MAGPSLLCITGFFHNESKEPRLSTQPHRHWTTSPAVWAGWAPNPCPCSGSTDAPFSSPHTSPAAPSSYQREQGFLVPCKPRHYDWKQCLTADNRALLLWSLSRAIPYSQLFRSTDNRLCSCSKLAQRGLNWSHVVTLPRELHSMFFYIYIVWSAPEPEFLNKL